MASRWQPHGFAPPLCTSLQAMQTKSCLWGASMSQVVVMMQCMLYAACETMMQTQAAENAHQIKEDSGL